jgi:very-short-patch-repair endonuclease
MNEITQKLHSKAIETVRPFAEELAKSGMCSGDIAVQVEKYVQVKVDQFYYQQEFESSKICNVIGNALPEIGTHDQADSKAEYIFHEILEKNQIPFRFQVKIGHYRVDFLIAGSIIFEGDGPHHKQQREYDEKRDKYLERMGYKVIRMPWSLIAQVQGDVILEIKNMIKKYKL